jgi:hypothetical protein
MKNVWVDRLLHLLAGMALGYLNVSLKVYIYLVISTILLIFVMSETISRLPTEYQSTKGGVKPPFVPFIVITNIGINTDIHFQTIKQIIQHYGNRIKNFKEIKGPRTSRGYFTIYL